MSDSSPNSHHTLRSLGLRQSRAHPRRKLIGPCHEGDATGRGQPIKSPFDPLEPTIDIALKNFGGVRSKNPKVPRTTRRAGKRVGHGERLLTIGGHLRRPSRTAHDGIPLAATMLLDDVRTPFGVTPRLPWRWLRQHVDPALGEGRSPRIDRASSRARRSPGRVPLRSTGAQTTGAPRGRATPPSSGAIRVWARQDDRRHRATKEIASPEPA
jgi:hypothetical protein